MSAAGPSKPLLDRIKAASRRKASREPRGDLVQELLVQLSSEAHELRTCARNPEDSLFSDAFPLLDFLLPLLSAAEIADDGSMNTSDYVRSCLILVATVCSPKEVVMGVEQALAELSRFESDDEEDDDEAAGAEVDVRDSAFQLACMTTMYANALPRIKTKRPLQFLSPAGAAIADGLRDFVSVGAFSAPSAASNSTSAPLQGDPLAKEAFRGVLLFVRSVCSWVVVSLDKEREVTELGSALALFEALLHQAVILLHLFVPANLASTYFYRRFPTYRRPGPPPEPTDGELAWELFDSIVYKLGVEPAKLLEMAASSRHPPQPQRLSSFVMLAHMVASPRGITPSSLGCTPESLLANTLDVVRRGLAHPVDKLAEDEALFWLWWCVEQQLELEEPLSKDVLFDLVDVLTPLTSLSPNPQTRFLAFRLIGRLVSTAHGDTLEGEATQVSLLRQLVVDCPSASLRAASVGLVKELLMDKLKLPLSSPSLFLDESFFSSSPLGTALLRFDPPNLAPGTLAASEFLEQHRAGVMERLSLLFVLLKRDQHNRTGVAAPSVVADLRAQLLDPLGAQLGRWLAARSTDAGDEGALEAEAALELELVQELLARVGEAVREVAERQA